MSNPRPRGLPKYLHVADYLRAQIDDGTYQPGERLPTEPELMDTFPYDRATIRRGLAVLRNEGLITSEQGRGVFVRDATKTRYDLMSMLITDRSHPAKPDAAYNQPPRGPDDGLAVEHSYEVIAAGEKLGAAFEIDPRSELLSTTFTFYISGDDTAEYRTTAYIPYPLVIDTPLATPSDEWPQPPIKDLLATVGVKVTTVAMDIESRMPTPQESYDLQIPDGTPVLSDRRRFLADDRVVCVTDSVGVADRIVYGLDLKLQ